MPEWDNWEEDPDKVKKKEEQVRKSLEDLEFDTEKYGEYLVEDESPDEFDTEHVSDRDQLLEQEMEDEQTEFDTTKKKFKFSPVLLLLPVFFIFGAIIFTDFFSPNNFAPVMLIDFGDYMASDTPPLAPVSVSCDMIDSVAVQMDIRGTCLTDIIFIEYVPLSASLNKDDEKCIRSAYYELARYSIGETIEIEFYTSLGNVFSMKYKIPCSRRQRMEVDLNQHTSD